MEGYGVVLAKPNENRHLLDQIPDFYDRLKRSYDDRFYEQEVLGQYLNVTAGRAYNQFDRNLHVGSTASNWRKPLLWALDFNVDPMCSIVAQMEGEHVNVLDEIVLHRATTWDACEEFRRRNRAVGEVIVYGDCSGNRAQTTGTSDYKMMKEFFRQAGMEHVEFRVPRSNPAVRERLELVNATLKNANGDQRLLVDPKCKELIKDFEQVVLQEGTMALDKAKAPNRTHLSDALGYLIWQELRHRSPVGPVNRRLLSF